MIIIRSNKYSQIPCNYTKCQDLLGFKYILKMIGNHKVLDLGCANGGYLQHFRKDSVGLDASMINCNKCKLNSLNVIGSNLNFPLGIKDHSFDAVFCSHTLEHVESPIQLLREANRLLNTNGLIVIGLPTEYSIVRFFYDHYFYGHDDHLYAFSLDNIKRLLELTGFEVVKVFIDYPLLKRIHLNFIFSILQLIPPKLAFFVSNAYWIVGKKID